MNPLHSPQGDDAEGKGRQRIDRIIAFNETVAEGRSSIFPHRRSCRRRRIGHHADDDEQDDHDSKNRGQYLTDAVEELRRRNRQPPGADEIKSRENSQRQHAVAGNGQDADRKGRRRRPRDSHERPDGQIHERQDDERKEGRNLMIHFRPETAGVEGPHDDGDDRHADAGQEKSQNRRRELPSRLEPKRRRENQVPGPEKHAEQQQSDLCTIFQHKQITLPLQF